MENIIVAFNSRKEPAKLSIPAGRYTIVCKDGKSSSREWGKYQVMKSLYRHALQ